MAPKYAPAAAAAPPSNIREDETMAKSRLHERYVNEVIPGLMKEFGYTNRYAVPHLQKIVLNMGLGEAIQNIKILDSATAELARIAGQKPIVTRARKSIANFKLRKNTPIGVAVTLRGERMYEFLDRLVNVALPRVRDFKGLSSKSFDGRGSYTLGLRDQLVFPEVDYTKVDKIKGMNITLVTTARSDEEARSLLRQLGVPLRD
jgi:large subunit ribosomal protein L5